uniref:G_PROTEIN_RECEP_F1_2 domain-containing protein n=1 Tax=Strongyloides venezuelensis TaxID=75913 RepID=A0A0K0EW85_STRVS
MNPEDESRPPPVATIGSTGISLEAIGIYNITMFVLGTISIVFNTTECYINIKHKLYNQSLYNCLRLYSNIGNSVLSGRHIVMSLINFSPLGNHPLMFSKEVCKYRGILDIFFVHLFQISYSLECFIFTVSIVFPLFYMIYLDRGIVKKCVGIYILIASIVPSTLLLKKDRSIPKALPRCIVYEIWTIYYHYYHWASTTIITILLIIAFLITTISMNKLGKKNKKDDEVRRNVCSFIRWTLLFFLCFWSGPNFFMVITKLFDLERELRKTFLDLFYVSVTVSQIIPFPFALWKNKIIKKYFLEINIIRKLTSRTSMTKIEVFKR